MVISSVSSSAQLRALPSPARGSPPGVSPNKVISAVTPELSGLERMLDGWRRRAEQKAEQYHQIELDGEARRRKEQQEINEIRARIIDARVKKLEQQQHSGGKGSNKSSLSGSPHDLSADMGRKRRSDDEYSATASDVTFACDSPASFTSESGGGGGNGFAVAKIPKLQQQYGQDKSPTSTTQQNSSVFIESFQLNPSSSSLSLSQTRPPPHVEQSAGGRSILAASSQHAGRPMVQHRNVGIPPSSPFTSSFTSMTNPIPLPVQLTRSTPSYAPPPPQQQQQWPPNYYYHQQQQQLYLQQGQQQQLVASNNNNRHQALQYQYPVAAAANMATIQRNRNPQIQPPWYNNDQQQQHHLPAVAVYRTQTGDVGLPRHIEEEMIRALPVNLDAALTPDFLRAIDDLEQA